MSVKPDPEGTLFYDSISHLPEPGNVGVGLSNPHLHQERRQLLDLVNRLHNTGVQVDIDLPQIAVIGSQSAGKSSLIEAISGITLPRAAGTCTRCPTECRLSRSTKPWRCTIFLRRMKDGKIVVEKFGDAILEDEKPQVEERIRRAQRAILNPSKPAKHYLTVIEDDSTESELSFSRDCVSLQISGPDVADLSFCDLPGLIAGVGRGGNKDDIMLVESLAISYIKKPSCIILLTVACETDFQNQGAQELAKAYDPEGKRTIGVLTKPDRIPIGEEPNWLEFIRNEKEPLENNWYCVKQPASSELKMGMSWSDARMSEDQFFSFTSPWADLEEMYKKYLRTSNLVDRLSSILSDLILKRIPEIQEELEKSILTTKEALAKLPKEPSEDPQNEIASLLHNFATELAKCVEGVPDENGLLQAIRPAQEKFRRAVRMTAPEFSPFEARYAGRKRLPKLDFLSNEEDNEGMDEIKANSECDIRYTKGSRPLAIEDYSLSNEGSYQEIDESEGDSGHASNVIYIDEVLKRAHQSRTRELEGNYPFIVQESFIKAIVSQWYGPAQILCKTVYVILIDRVKQLVSECFSSFGQGGLEQRIRVLIQDHFKQRMATTEVRIAWLLDLENRPFTLNHHYLADYKDKFLAYYKGARVKDRNATLMSSIQSYVSPAPGLDNAERYELTGIAKIMAGLAEIGINGTKPEELAKLIPPDGMEPALVIMAEVRAYFQVAYKRVADNIPLAIDHDLVRGVGQSVLVTLSQGLGINTINGHQICKELAQESPIIARKREEIMKKLERMNGASQELLRIGF